MKTYIITGATGFWEKGVRHLLMNGHCMILLVRGENRKIAEGESLNYLILMSESRRIHTFDCDTRYLDKFLKIRNFKRLSLRIPLAVFGTWRLI